MAVGKCDLPVMMPVKGVAIGVASAGIKKPGRPDLVVFELCEGASVAGVFTTNAFCAAPVVLCKQHLALALPRYLLINTGNANAGTGAQGMQDAVDSCRALAKLAKVEVQQVLPFSTGVIGEPLPVGKLVAALPQALKNCDTDNWGAAASGIMTTDTRPKGASVSLMIGGECVTLTGISKGAGMIKPNMATMLGFVATDAKIAPPLLNKLHRQAAERSFNRITIDGDTSTNDSCILVATGKSSAPEITEGSPDFLRFEAALNQLMLELAQLIVRDGEGATKFVTVRVQEAAASDEALQVAYAVAHSPLVKTALFASDPNWGRILAAVGRAGLANLDLARIHIFLDEVCIVDGGARSPGYREEQGQAVMDREEITIRIVLGRGEVCETVWTTDLSHDYVTINAEYRT